MSAKWEKTEKNEGVLTVEVEEKLFNEALDQAFNKVVKKVNVPGFRKGKVPRRIFEARFGIESLYQDALDIVLPEAYQQAVEETGIEPVDRPEIDIDRLEQGQSVIFKATVTVKPEVTLGEYEGLEIPAKDFTVTDELVDEELERVRNRQAELNVVEDGVIEDGDTAVIDFEGFVDDEPFEGGSAENHSLEIGSKSFIPGFEEQLIGLKKEEEKEVSVQFPEDYHAEHLQGKDAVFKVKVHEIKRKKLPELDDEFAKDVSEFETLDEYKQDLRTKLEEQQKQEEDNYKRNTVIDKATENAVIDIPEVMITQEAERMKDEFGQRLQMQGMNLDLYMQMTGSDEEALKEQFKEDAAKRVRTQLTLEAISELKNFEVTAEEIDEELSKMAEMYQRDKAEIREMLESQGQIEAITNDLKIRKTVDYLVQESKSVA